MAISPAMKIPAITSCVSAKVSTSACWRISCTSIFMLASDPERVFSRDDLAAAIWGTDTLGESRAVDVHIRRLRAKLEPFEDTAPAIVTVRGFGYKLAADSPPEV